LFSADVLLETGAILFHGCAVEEGAMILKFENVSPDALARLLNFTKSDGACQPVIVWDQKGYVRLTLEQVVTVLSFKQDTGVTARVVLKVREGVNSLPSRWAERPIPINPDRPYCDFQYEGGQRSRPMVERFDVPGFESMPDFKLPDVDVFRLNSAMDNVRQVGIAVQGHVIRGIHEALGLFQDQTRIVKTSAFTSMDWNEKDQ